MKHNIKNILVVNVNWLGDTIFATPVFKALKEYYPGSRLTCLTVPSVQEILQMCPFVDEVMPYNERGEGRGIGEQLRIIQQLRQNKFDVAYLLRPSSSRAFMLFLSGISLRVGLKTGFQRFLLSHSVNPLTIEKHRSDEYAHIIESFQIPIKDRTCQLKAPSENLKKMQASLTSLGLVNARGFVVINAGGNWDLKRWPKENFATLIRHLIREFHEDVLIVGAEKDLDLVHSIVRLSGEKPYILTGQTSLKDLAAIFTLAKLFISADTGPLHLASSVGCKTIALFGPTRPEITGPRGKGPTVILNKDVGCNRAPCFHLTCQQNVCMQSISVDDVCQAYQQFKN